MLVLLLHIYQMKMAHQESLKYQFVALKKELLRRLLLKIYRNQKCWCFHLESLEFSTCIHSSLYLIRRYINYSSLRIDHSDRLLELIVLLVYTFSKLFLNITHSFLDSFFDHNTHIRGLSTLIFFENILVGVVSKLFCIINQPSVTNNSSFSLRSIHQAWNSL